MSEDKDVGRVLAKLKEEVRRGSTTAPGAPQSQPVGLRRLYATTHVNPHLPIGWPKLPQGILPKIVAIVQKVIRRGLRWYINPIVEQQNAYNVAATAVIESLMLQKVSQEELEALRLRLQRLERAARQAAPTATAAVASTPIQNAERGAPRLDYFGLELKFRGPRLLREQQKAYLKYFQGRQDVLDIGCGRGEFVEMLSESGVRARGIDLDPDSVACAQERGVPVEFADALPYLEGLRDDSLGGVFASQVVEHLEPRHLVGLLELCYDKLAPEAPIVLETLNPACLWALANWFLIDPTHVWPVHSEMLRFVLENAGFHRIEIVYLSPVPIEQRLLNLPEHAKLKSVDPDTVALLNHNIDRANGFLFGYQDYAAIAYRPPKDPGEGR
jgi:SAM-dependent methyltransferase